MKKLAVKLLLFLHRVCTDRKWLTEAEVMYLNGEVTTVQEAESFIEWRDNHLSMWEQEFEDAYAEDVGVRSIRESELPF